MYRVKDLVPINEYTTYRGTVLTFKPDCYYFDVVNHKVYSKHNGELSKLKSLKKYAKHTKEIHYRYYALSDVNHRQRFIPRSGLAKVFVKQDE